jgi:hypothetical protein
LWKRELLELPIIMQAAGGKKSSKGFCSIQNAGGEEAFDWIARFDQRQNCSVYIATDGRFVSPRHTLPCLAMPCFALR